MCFSAPKIPDPKPAPAPPQAKDATLAAVSEQRAAAARQGAAANILTKLRDEDVAATGAKKKLGA